MKEVGGHQAQREKKPIDLRADGRTGLSRVFCIDQAGTFVGWIELCTAPTERLALARLLRKFFQNLRYGRERPKVARKLRSLAGGWAPLYGRAAAEEIFSEVI